MEKRMQKTPKGKSKSHYEILHYEVHNKIRCEKPLKVFVGQFDVMHVGSHLVICKVRHMKYQEGDVFLLPHNYDSRSKQFVNWVKFRNAVASDLFQKELADLLSMYLVTEQITSVKSPNVPTKVLVTTNNFEKKKTKTAKTAHSSLLREQSNRVTALK